MCNIKNPFRDLGLDEEWNKLPREIQQYYVDVKLGNKALTITNDHIFKRIFDPDLHKDRISKLLSYILKQKVKVLHSLRNENVPESIYSKKMIMDIVAQLKSGEYCIVEMQVVPQDFIDKRLAVYSADFILRQYSASYYQPKKNITFSSLRKVYTIVIMVNSPDNFKQNEHYCHHFKQTSDTGLELDLLQEYIFIELENFTRVQTYQNIDNELDAWLLFIATDNIEIKNNLIKDYPEFNLMYKEALNMLRDRKELLNMFTIDFEQIERNSLLEQGREQGKKEGREQGKKEGREQGKKEGREQGKKEEKIKIAKELISIGLTIEQISKGTGLTIEEVKKLM